MVVICFCKEGLWFIIYVRIKESFSKIKKIFIPILGASLSWGSIGECADSPFRGLQVHFWRDFNL